MFDSLTSKLQTAFKNLRGLGKISEANVADALREVRMALLEADVNFKVARDFIERVKAKSLGTEVINSVQPGQHELEAVLEAAIRVAVGDERDRGRGELGRGACRQRPAERQQQLTAEVRQFLRVGGRFDFSGLLDVSELLHKSRIAGAALETGEIRDFLLVVDRAQQWRAVVGEPPTRMRAAGGREKPHPVSTNAGETRVGQPGL